MGSQNGGIQHYVGKQNLRYSLLWLFKCIGIQICGYSKMLWVIKMYVCESRQNLWVVKKLGYSTMCG